MFVERLGVINIFLLLIYSLIKKEVKMEEGATMKDVVVAVMVDQFLAKFLLLD
jgi:membrane protein involved in colicin uptake